MLSFPNKKCCYQGAATRINRRKEKKGDSKDGRAPGIHRRFEGECSDDKKWKMARGGRLAKLNAGKGSKRKHPRESVSVWRGVAELEMVESMG